MWGPLLVLALLTTINPVRLGLILLVLSRPRPMHNLLAYWVGALLVGLATLLVPLIALHSTPTSASFARDFANPTANPGAQWTAIGIGALLLAAAALMAVRSLARTTVGSRQPVPDRNGDTDTDTSTLLLANAPPIFSRLLQSAEDDAPAAATAGGSPIRQLLGRARTAWKNGSPWIAFVIGIIVLPPLDGVVFALAMIATSGAAFGMQVGAAIAFVIGVLAVEETILVSNLLAPTKTQAVLRQLRDWAQAHHRKFVAAILALVGAWLVIRGMGIL